VPETPCEEYGSISEVLVDAQPVARRLPKSDRLIRAALRAALNNDLNASGRTQPAATRPKACLKSRD
jgi:hypothetical protein